MSRGQEIERLHRISTDPNLVPAVRCYAAGACEALSSNQADPEDWQVDPEPEDVHAFLSGWRAARDGTISLPAAQNETRIAGDLLMSIAVLASTLSLAGCRVGGLLLV